MLQIIDVINSIDNYAKANEVRLELNLTNGIFEWDFVLSPSSAKRVRVNDVVEFEDALNEIKAQIDDLVKRRAEREEYEQNRLANWIGKFSV